jgi:hypothetical protein
MTSQKTWIMHPNGQFIILGYLMRRMREEACKPHILATMASQMPCILRGGEGNPWGTPLPNNEYYIVQKNT